MRIGELASRTGTTTKTIRYYEDIGLLLQPDRAANDYRDYPEEAVDRLHFVRDVQATGLTLTEIASILDLRSQGETTCHHVVDLLERHLVALDRHITLFVRPDESSPTSPNGPATSTPPTAVIPTAVRQSAQPAGTTRRQTTPGSTSTPPRPVTTTDGGRREFWSSAGTGRSGRGSSPACEKATTRR
ncbi:MAG TPA: heavy metal-responsive transcriptional regulator [Acidimicrobiia bacterium]|nr:heavy metal-responsive transcriptional regulator [Acidimicrobiia bacterium]